MLETIKQCMQDLPCISFEQYLRQVICSLQDELLDKEFRSMNSVTFRSIQDICSIVDSELLESVMTYNRC